MMDIDKYKLGIVEYGRKIEQELKTRYIGRVIIDVEYNYFLECFDFLLDNGERITLEV